MKGNAELFLADATLYLATFFRDDRHLLGMVVAGRQGPPPHTWKIYGMQYFFGYETGPNNRGLSTPLPLVYGLNVENETEFFE